ncbi:hypothetical protein BG58_31360 [Caballeronia jiangsuensis]|nr:hypothetical protein BG58_31360 [Caballeronia jiangsuensis]
MSNQANAAGLLAFLWTTFEPGKASDEELKFLAGAACEASSTARSLSHTVSGVGCLVAEDLDNGQKSGALQGEGLPSFLFGISEQLDTIAQMAFIGSEAASYLDMRQGARTKAVARRARTGEDSSKEGA